MEISKITQSEDLRLSHFILAGKACTLNEIQITIPFGTAPFAVAAMLKGLEEHFFKPAGMMAEGVSNEQNEHNLKLWLEKCNAPAPEAPSNLIVPG